MTLDTYKAKRNFRKTPEPGPRQGQSGRQPIFVVQEHHASRLHYDFRLEADGVLKSWAVPKEPTHDPAQKRLAVHVEDHPLEYASFEGKIPDGEYGAGTVKIWDRGTYENLLAAKPEPQTVTEGIDSGHVEVELKGERLRGKFALVRMGGRLGGKGKDNWLLIKMKDEFAQPDRKPSKAKAAVSKRASKAKTAAPASASNGKTAARANGRNANSRASKAAATARAPAEFRDFTHTDKIMFPEDGFTKGDVLAFYERIADRLLPFLRDRPVTLERVPEGLAGPDAPHFWQKDTPEYYPDWIPRVILTSAAGKQVHYVLVNDAATLLYLVNQGTITFHVWLSRVTSLDRPDFVLFDLDRGRAAFTDVVEVAQAVRAILKAERQDAFVKTSGKTGLHLLVPWAAEGGYDEARAWALRVAELTGEALPERATHDIRKAKRGRRVYIDVMQNARGHHAVPPYVVRAVPAASVSTPLNWREVTKSLDPAAFTLETIFSRLARQKTDPFADLVESWKS
jgi:bifunctional non-homologous end joining protein LigD